MPSTATSKPLVIIPSENQTREFDAKLLLACELAQRGFEVVVGARHEIHNKIARFRQGIYFAKDFRKPSERILEIIAGLGHYIVAWDEEGIVQPLPQLYYERRWSLPAIKNVSEVFAWGPANERLMLGAPSWPGIKIHQTGNLRIPIHNCDSFHRYHCMDHPLTMVDHPMDRYEFQQVHPLNLWLT